MSLLAPNHSGRFVPSTTLRAEADRVQLASRRQMLGFLAMTPAALYVTGCASAADDAGLDDNAGALVGPDGTPIAEGEACGGLTTRDAKGPYYVEGAPVKSRIAPEGEEGERFIIEGRIFNRDCTRAFPNLVVDCWQADHDGHYFSTKLRGKVITDASGRYTFDTIIPGRYEQGTDGFRPAHLHMKIATQTGRDIITTQIYFAGDPFLAQEDFCTVGGACNSADPDRHLNLRAARLDGAPVQRATYNFRLNVA